MEEQRTNRNHFVRVGVIWLVATLVLEVGLLFWLRPNMPPFQASAQASEQANTNSLLTGLAIPVMLLVWVFVVYSIVVFRRKGEEDGPAIRGHYRTQLAWVVSSAVIVLFLAGYGSYVLMISAYGVGGGQGPDPAAVPAGQTMEVQVIAQEWGFTYRYPTYGGVETQQMVLPVNQLVELHVTSLDVIHSFWAYEIGVKADANPGQDNIAFAKPVEVAPFQIRCAELCGLWHGYMFGTGQVVSQSDFAAWIATQQSANAAATAQLPPYAHVYQPVPAHVRGG
jgi:cytochrome c oxidase subunit II